MGFIYQYPTDNVVGNATITSSGSPSDFPVANLWDGAPGSPAKLTATTGWFKFQYAAPQIIELVSIIHANLTPSLTNVNIQGNATDSWGAPSFNQSFVIPGYRGTGLPVNPFLDLRSLPGYNPSGFLWWRLNFGTANGANISIGEFWMSPIYREFPYGIQRGATRNWKFNNSIDVTDAGQTVGYELAAAQRRINFNIDFLGISNPDKVVKETIISWIEYCRGRLRPFLIVQDSTLNDAILAKGDEDEPGYATSSFGKHDMSLNILEVGRGVAP